MSNKSVYIPRNTRSVVPLIVLRNNGIFRCSAGDFKIFDHNMNEKCSAVATVEIRTGLLQFTSQKQAELRPDAWNLKDVDVVI